MLLSSEHGRQTEAYDQWKDLFTLAYQKSVEEGVALGQAEEDRIARELRGETP